MKIKKLSVKILAVILSAIIVVMTSLTVISAVNSKSIIDRQNNVQMTTELTSQLRQIDSYMKVIKSSAMDFSQFVANTYKTADIDQYLGFVEDMISNNDFMLGSGVWFEPYAYDAKEEYMGPYVYKDGTSLVTTYDYSNAEYDYFNQEYYTNTKATKEAVITDPYFDETSQIVMASCSAAIYDGDTYLGCVTIDIGLTTINELVQGIQVGDGGTAILLTSGGTYIGSRDDAKVSDSLMIQDEANVSLAQAGSKILAGTSGMETYSDQGKKYNLYYDTLGGLNWKLVIQMPVAELNQPVNQLVITLVTVCLVAVLLLAGLVLLVVAGISKGIKRVQQFAFSLANGDFTIEQLQVKSHDELGAMGDSLNEMYMKNRHVIGNIAEKAVAMNQASEQLSRAASELNQRFDQIEVYMTKVNEDMFSASAATEEVHASTEEVYSAVSILAEQTESSKGLTVNIKQRASEIGASSTESYRNATALSEKYNRSLTESIQNAQVVENIGTLAGVISGIAEQINLLSLNASIEAARAGEQGRGFAIVATEIGKLANETTHAVEQIQATIEEVQGAFSQLSSNSKSLLSFVQQTVTPDYNKFVDVAKQYGEDALMIEESANLISGMANNIRNIMNEVSEAIQNIAETSQNTAINSNKIMNTVSELNQVVDQVSTMAQEQEEIAGNLQNVVEKFKIN